MGNTPGLTLLLVGDVVATRRLHAATHAGHFRRFQALANQADAVFGNFETLIHDYESPASHFSGGTWLRAPAAVADDLAELGFTLMSRANNHAMDFGVPALLRTTAELDRAHIAHAGAGRDEAEARTACFAETASGRVALVSVCSTLAEFMAATATADGIPARPGIAPLRFSHAHELPQNDFELLKGIATRRGLNPELFGPDTVFFPPYRFLRGSRHASHTVANPADLGATVRAVTEARRVADIVVLSIHSHDFAGEHETPADFVTHTAHACIEAGASLVVGHGPHVLRGLEIYAGAPILHGLGTFLFQHDNLHRLPADARHKAGLPAHASTADIHAASFNSFHEERFRETAAVLVSFDTNHTALEVTFVPMEIMTTGRWATRGLPIPASPTAAERILHRLATLSAQYECQLTALDGKATWRRQDC